MAGHKKWGPLESNPVACSTTSQLNWASTPPNMLSVTSSAWTAGGRTRNLLSTPNTEAATKKEDEEQASSGVAASCPAYYMKQTIGNACGTIAVLHGLANNRDTMKPAAGSFLDQFFTATAGLDPSACGVYLEHPPEGAPSIL
eukprot:gene21678-28697_t